ncbi:MAG: hypothetical protein GY930_01995 [bacterium]|nr:hypothetical protein [bacterium]
MQHTLNSIQSMIVRCATIRPADSVHGTPLACTRRPGGTPCKGTIHVQHCADEVEWECRGCGDSGCITDWQGGEDDFSALQGTGGGEGITIRFGSDVYGQLLVCFHDSFHAAQFLWAAQAEQQQVAVTTSEADWMAFIEALAMEEGASHSGAGKRRLAKAFRTLNKALNGDEAIETSMEPDPVIQIEPLLAGLRLSVDQKQRLADAHGALSNSRGAALGRSQVDKQVRTMGEVLILRRQLDGILRVASAETGAVPLFMTSVAQVLEAVDSMVHRDRRQAFDTYAYLIEQVALAMPNLTVSPREVSGFMKAAADKANVCLQGAHKLAYRRTDLIQLCWESWLADRLQVFQWVPDWTESLDLQTRERNALVQWLEARDCQELATQWANGA